MRALITGADGQLGWELQRTAPSAWEVKAFNRAGLDILDGEQVRRTVSELDPSLIVNTAAYTAVDRAEEEQQRAHAVNAEGARYVALAAVEHGARLIHISTDFVFDGENHRPYTSRDAPNPIGVYGVSKMEGERHVLDICRDAAIILRTGWVYSIHGNNFVKTMLRLNQDRDELKIVADQFGTPTWAKGLAEVIWRIAANRDLLGIYHWTDAGVASWYDFAVAIQEEAMDIGLLKNPASIVPIATEEYPTPAKRPPFSVLDKSRTWGALGMVSPHWRTSLRQMLVELKDHGAS